jgi:hypothetical protein
LNFTDSNLYAPTINFAGPSYGHAGGDFVPATVTAGPPPSAAPLGTQPNLNAPPEPDPLRFLPIPTSAPIFNNYPAIAGVGPDVTLQPGTYVGGLSISGSRNVILQPGIYVMQAGFNNYGFSFGSTGSLTGDGVMIYNDPTGGGGPLQNTINITGSGAVTLTPPSSGTYQGISIFQARNANNFVTINHLSGSTNP